MTPIERQAERAMHRMNASINRSAGQHMRAIRKARAQLVIESVDTEQLQPEAFVSRIADKQEADDAMSAMRMLAYALVSLALVGAAVTLAVFITVFNQP
jgi:hypothetical protein